MDQEIRQFCRLDTASESLMRTAMAKMHLSARAFHRLLKLARSTTIATRFDRAGLMQDSDMLCTEKLEMSKPPARERKADAESKQ